MGGQVNNYKYYWVTDLYSTTSYSQQIAVTDSKVSVKYLFKDYLCKIIANEKPKANNGPPVTAN